MSGVTVAGVIPRYDTEMEWLNDMLPRVLPFRWELVKQNRDGAMFLVRGLDRRMSVIVSGAVELDGRRWIHLSCANPDRLPSWEDLVEVKTAILGGEATAYQVIPPKAQHVNIHPNCLHLFACADGPILPDFTWGGTTL